MFAVGQAYVALSRARNLEGLQILDMDPDCVKVGGDLHKQQSLIHPFLLLATAPPDTQSPRSIAWPGGGGAGAPAAGSGGPIAIDLGVSVPRRHVGGRHPTCVKVGVPLGGSWVPLLRIRIRPVASLSLSGYVSLYGLADTRPRQSVWVGWAQATAVLLITSSSQCTRVGGAMCLSDGALANCVIFHHHHPPQVDPCVVQFYAMLRSGQDYQVRVWVGEGGACVCVSMYVRARESSRVAVNASERRGAEAGVFLLGGGGDVQGCVLASVGIAACHKQNRKGKHCPRHRTVTPPPPQPTRCAACPPRSCARTPLPLGTHVPHHMPCTVPQDEAWRFFVEARMAERFPGTYRPGSAVGSGPLPAWPPTDKATGGARAPMGPMRPAANGPNAGAWRGFGGGPGGRAAGGGAGRGGGRSRANDVCYKCKQVGHWASACPGTGR